MWYPQNPDELERTLNILLKKDHVSEKHDIPINGIIVPHAGYQFSGPVAGKAFSKLNGNKAIVIGPSHYMPTDEIVTSDKSSWKTPLGKMNLTKADFPSYNIDREHSITNQIPFLQKLGFKEVLPIMIGQIDPKEARKIANKLAQLDGKFIFSTDLSHFLPYEEAIKKDKETIRIIENLDLENAHKLDACGNHALLVLIFLCKIKDWKPKLIEYKNSGDITGQKDKVVGYASFTF